MARVLLIDDDDYVRATVRRMLTLSGFEVEELADGAEALVAYRARPADVVVCDVFMPGKDGIEILRDLRGEFPEVRVVAMSGGGCGGKFDALPLVRDLGAAGALPKPFTRSELLEVVRRVLPDPPT